MGNSTNRSLQAKYKKSLTQRQALAEKEYTKPAYRSDKPALRTIAANAQHMVVPANKSVIKTCTDIVYTLYNPSIYRKPKPAMWAAYVDCDNELYR